MGPSLQVPLQALLLGVLLILSNTPNSRALTFRRANLRAGSWVRSRKPHNRVHSAFAKGIFGDDDEDDFSGYTPSEIFELERLSEALGDDEDDVDDDVDFDESDDGSVIDVPFSSVSDSAQESKGESEGAKQENNCNSDDGSVDEEGGEDGTGDEEEEGCNSDDPYENLSYEELDRLEAEAIAARLGGGSNRQRAEPPAPPLAQEHAFYRFSQTDDLVEFSVPLPGWNGVTFTRSDVSLALGPEAFQLGVKKFKELPLLGGVFRGKVDPSSVDFDIIQPEPSDGGRCLDPSIRVRVNKVAAEGTVELWYGLLEAAHPQSPTVKFSWQQDAALEAEGGDEGGPLPLQAAVRRQRRPAYEWEQRKDVFTLAVKGLPAATRRDDVRVGLSKDGRSAKIRVASAPELGVLEGKFSGTVRPSVSTWFLTPPIPDGGGEGGDEGSAGSIEGEKGTRSLEVELVKRHLPRGEGAGATDDDGGNAPPGERYAEEGSWWWPSLFQGSEADGQAL